MSPTRASAADPAVGDPPAARRWRWLLPLLAVPLLAFLLLRWALQPERLGALLLARASAASGLQLDVERPARLGLWPGLQLELPGLQARLPGRPPLLQAQRVDVALPLSVLWRRELEFGELALHAPRLDLAELQRWRARELDAGPPEPPSLPGFAVTLAVRDGELRFADGALRGIDLDASPLRDALPFAATATLVRHGGERALPVRVRLSLLPRQLADGIALESIRLEFGAASETSLRGEGRALLDAAAQLDATLQLQLADRWPAQWPAVPAQAWTQLGGRTFTLDYRGGLDFDGELALQSQATDPLQAQTNPRRLLEWLGADDASPLPPVESVIEVGRLELDGTVIEGLRLELRADDASPPADGDDDGPGGGDAAAQPP
jgi:uncharacterized protein involved in outer membrane biogenesis